MKSPIIVENLLCPSCQDHVLDKRTLELSESVTWRCSNCGFEMTEKEYEDYNVERFKAVHDIQAQLQPKHIPARKFGSSKK